jgi:hypothetical protein
LEQHPVSARVSKADFLADVRAARSELLRILGRSDQGTLGSTKVPGMDWTAKDVLSHLIGYDLAITGAIKDIRAGRAFAWGWTYPNFDPWNERNVGPRRGRSFAVVLAELEASRAAVLGELEGWPDDAGPFGPDTWDPTKSEIGWLGSHEREHAEMIATLGASQTGEVG